jgi:hypothetical protein
MVSDLVRKQSVYLTVYSADTFGRDLVEVMHMKVVIIFMSIAALLSVGLTLLSNALASPGNVVSYNPVFGWCLFAVFLATIAGILSAVRAGLLRLPGWCALFIVGTVVYFGVALLLIVLIGYAIQPYIMMDPLAYLLVFTAGHVGFLVAMLLAFRLRRPTQPAVLQPGVVAPFPDALLETSPVADVTPSASDDVQRAASVALEPTVPEPHGQPSYVVALSVNKSRRRYVSYPWLLLVSVIVFPAFALAFFHPFGYSSSKPFGSLEPYAGLFGLLYLVAVPLWVIVVVQAIRLRRWGWLAFLLLIPCFSWIVFGLAGPTERAQKSSMNVTVTTLGESRTN